MAESKSSPAAGNVRDPGKTPGSAEGDCKTVDQELSNQNEGRDLKAAPGSGGANAPTSGQHPSSSRTAPANADLPKLGQSATAGRVDVTGVTPGNVHVDPNITAGHPGYEESGDSEIVPNQPEAKEGKKKASP